MARNIAANADEGWRAVLVMKSAGGSLWYDHQGVYSKKGTAVARITYYRRHVPTFYDGWVERCAIVWEKVQD